MTTVDPTAIDRLKRWRSHGDGPVTYTAGSKQFGDDVIVLLMDAESDKAEIERLQAALKEAPRPIPGSLARWQMAYSAWFLTVRQAALEQSSGDGK